MNLLPLACRFYSINPEVLNDVRELFLNSKEEIPFHYDQFTDDKGKNVDLSIVIKKRIENSYGHLLNVWIDQPVVILDREEGKIYLRYYREYEIQFLSERENFKNHLIFFGPKNIDARLKKAIYHYLQKKMENVPDALRLLRVDLKTNIDSIMKTYPDLQHFCTDKNPDDRVRAVNVKGNQLEQTDMYDRFVKDEETSGLINFLGITVEGGKLVYVGSDGSVYSKFNFKADEKVRIVYDIYSRFKKIKIFTNTLDNYNN